jgi:peptide/nickel transport system substrate-binding protein
VRSWLAFLAVALIWGGCPYFAWTEPNHVSRTLAPAGSPAFPNPGPFKLVLTKGKDGQERELLQSRGELGQYGGTLTLCTFGVGPKTFNCWASEEMESGGIGLLMWERLVDTDAWTGKPYPRLAKSVVISADKCTYTITLRKGLKWSDGKPITADDVVFTMNTLVKKGYGAASASWRDLLALKGQFPECKKIDDLTVQIHTSVPFAPFYYELCSVQIAPKHVLEPITKKPMSEFADFWDINCDPKTLVVSGRFKLERFVPGQRVEFVRNPYYAMVDKKGRPLPYLDRLTEAIVPDQNTEILKFYGDEIDLLDVRSVRGEDAAIMKEREAAGNYHMYNLGPDDGTLFLMFNMKRGKDPKTGKYYVDPIKQKWFNNVYFRRAISHAVDRRRIVDNVLRGVGEPLYTAEPSSSVYFDKDLPAYPQDLKLAAELLKQGGFVLKDGKLYDQDGHMVEFTLITNSGNSARDGVCVMIVNDLEKLGIKANYQTIDFNIMIDKTDTSLDWEAIVMALSGSKIEPYDGANVWRTDSRMHLYDERLPNDKGQVTVSDARDWEKQIDQLFDQAATTFDDKKRHQYYDQYQKIVYDEQPYIYLYSMWAITACKNKVGNYKPLPLGVFWTPLGTLHNLEEIYIRKPGN